MTEDEMVGITDSMDVTLSKLQKIVMDKRGVLLFMQFKTQTRLSDRATRVSTTPPSSGPAPSPHCHNLQPKVGHKW